MADEHQDNAPADEGARPEWIKEAEEALERATAAIRSAWSETRESRMNALGSAQKAAKQLGEAIDRGVDAARSRWQEAGGEESPSGDGAAPARETGAGEEE